MPAFFRKEIINNKAATITIPFHINPRALKPIFVTVFPKNNIRIIAPMTRAIFWYLFIYVISNVSKQVLNLKGPESFRDEVS